MPDIIYEGKEISEIPEYEALPYKCLYCHMITRGIHKVGENLTPYMQCSYCGKYAKLQ